LLPYVIGTGLIAGLAHVVTGPDHLAAIAPITISAQRRHWYAGLMWGVGHSSGVWILAALGLAFRGVIDVEPISMWSERLVGVVLIAIGLWGLRKVAALRIHVHEHEHDDVRHVHAHFHEASEAHRPVIESGLHSHTHGALSVGVLHGLAGSSHLLGVLPALLLPSNAGAIGYIVAFGLGSIAGMTSFSFLLGKLVMRLDTARERFYRWILGSSSAAAIVVGVIWLAIA